MTPQDASQALIAAGYTKNGDVYEKSANGYIHTFVLTSDKVKYRAVRDYTFNMTLSLDAFHPDEIKWFENDLEKYCI